MGQKIFPFGRKYFGLGEFKGGKNFDHVLLGLVERLIDIPPNRLLERTREFAGRADMGETNASQPNKPSPPETSMGSLGDAGSRAVDLGRQDCLGHFPVI